MFSPTRATNIVFSPTNRLCISPILYRVFTHLDSCFHTPFIVFSHTVYRVFTHRTITERIGFATIIEPFLTRNTDSNT